MNPNKLTEKATEAIVAAQREAENRQHATLDVDHLVYALVDQEGGVVPRVLEVLGASPSEVLADIERALEAAPTLQYSAQATLSGHLRTALQKAEDEMQGTP